MTSSTHIQFLKLLHTMIWLVMASAVFYVLYSGLSGHTTTLSYIAAILVILEGGALAYGKGECPLYMYTLKVSGKKAMNDTFLPEWIFFPHYKKVMTVLYLIGLYFMIVR